MKVLDLTYVRYPDSAIGFVCACASLLPLFLIFSLAPVAIFARKLSPLVFLFGIVTSTAINETLKRIVRQPRPEFSHRDGYGMPSDHSQFCLFWTCYLLKVFWHNPTIKRSFVCLLTGFNIVAASLVLFSRIYLGVHTVAQVCVGAVIGAVLGLVWGHLSSRVLSSKTYSHVECNFGNLINKLVFQQHTKSA